MDQLADKEMRENYLKNRNNNERSNSRNKQGECQHFPYGYL